MTTSFPTRRSSDLLPLADARADVDEARHQHRALADMRAVADDRAGHRAEAGVPEAVLAPAGEFRRHLVPPGRTAGAALADRHVVEEIGRASCRESVCQEG